MPLLGPLWSRWSWCTVTFMNVYNQPCQQPTRFFIVSDWALTARQLGILSLPLSQDLSPLLSTPLLVSVKRPHTNPCHYPPEAMLCFKQIMKILYGAKEWCRRIWLLLCRNWTDLDEICCTVSTLLGAGPGRFWARSVQ